jgi:hypothetical protein
MQQNGYFRMEIVLFEAYFIWFGIIALFTVEVYIIPLKSFHQSIHEFPVTHAMSDVN